MANEKRAAAMVAADTRYLNPSVVLIQWYERGNLWDIVDDRCYLSEGVGEKSECCSVFGDGVCVLGEWMGVAALGVEVVRCEFNVEMSNEWYAMQFLLQFSIDWVLFANMWLLEWIRIWQLKWKAILVGQVHFVIAMACASVNWSREMKTGQKEPVGYDSITFVNWVGMDLDITKE